MDRLYKSSRDFFNSWQLGDMKWRSVYRKGLDYVFISNVPFETLVEVTGLQHLRKASTFLCDPMYGGTTTPHIDH